MADDIRQKMDEIVVRFQTVTTANGYETNIGSNVNLWRPHNTSPFSGSDLDALNLKDTVANAGSDDTPMGVSEYEMEIQAEAVTKDVAIPTDKKCRKMLADLIKAIGTDRYFTVSGSRLVWDSRIVTSSIDVQQVGDIIGGCQLAFTVLFRINNFDPYTTRH